MLRDCYLYDRDVYFLSGYLSAQRLNITRSSIQQGLQVGLPSTQDTTTDRFEWSTDGVFAVVLQKIGFKLGSGIASLGDKFTQFLPQFDFSQVRSNGQVFHERLEIFLEDW